jgi:hypothetical protein
VGCVSDAPFTTMARKMRTLIATSAVVNDTGVRVVETGSAAYGSGDGFGLQASGFRLAHSS